MITSSCASCAGQPPGSEDADTVSGSSPPSKSALLTNVQPLTSADLDLGHIDAAPPLASAKHSSQPQSAQAAESTSAAEPQDPGQEGNAPADDANPKVLLLQSEQHFAIARCIRL
jgi:hypothetical protein